MAEADAVVELTVTTPSTPHNSLETHGTVAAWEGDQLTLYESTQHVYGVRSFAAKRLKIPFSKVRAIGTFMGGGFGSKFPENGFTMIAALLAKQARRPVHLMYNREEENIEAGYRGASVQHVRLGATKDGKLTGVELDGQTECGSYATWIVSLSGPYEMMYASPNMQLKTTGIFTNVGPFKAFRAPGFVEGMVGLEAGMDDLAERLGLDPLEFRRRNIPTHDRAEEKPFSSFPLAECFRRGAEVIGWERRKPNAAARQATGRYRRGLGMSSQIWWGGGGPPAYAEIQLDSDGSATVLTGVQDLGTGARTIFAQVAAEELGLEMDMVNVTIGDTFAGPFGPASGGSVTTGSMTPAVRAAAHDLRVQLCSIVCQLQDIPEQELEIRAGKIYRRDTELASVQSIMRKLGDVMLTGKGSRGPNPPEVSVVTSGAQFAEVEVDTVTGRVRVIKVVAAHDSGRIMNPQTFTSQIHGGIIQGLGFALTEERIIDHAAGKVMNPNLEWYKLPTIADTPEIVNLLIDIPDTLANPTGAKGAGEPGIIPTAAAIANAVANALGVRVCDLPITPARVLEALES
ncbi:MAG: xanthine dehydrogenase family protein molybdopterin-binding subunit [Herpetosiphon sp.]